MQADFHYSCTAVLARAAGFSPSDALTIAYACQYVDDSTESWPIMVGALPFDPVRTAHVGLEAFDWSVQKRVYIPFHFIPPDPFKVDDTTFAFTTSPDTPFIASVLAEAASEKRPVLRLCRIGVALHTFADTWSHRDFSGIKENANDVEAIEVREKGRWKCLVWENAMLDFAPKIGHAQASTFPDRTYLTWKYRGPDNKPRPPRNNTDDFVIAARRMYEILVPLANTPPAPLLPFDKLEPDVRRLFSSTVEDVDARCAAWAKAFGNLFKGHEFAYSKYDWRLDALEPAKKEDVYWEGRTFDDSNRPAFKMRRGFYKSPWVQFHWAALLQRHFVLENMP